MMIVSFTAMLMSANGVFAALNAPAYATTDVTMKAVDCKTIADPDARLLCFDNLFSSEPTSASKTPVKVDENADAGTEISHTKQVTAEKTVQLLPVQELSTNVHSPSAETSVKQVPPVTVPSSILAATADVSHSEVESSQVKTQDEKLLERFGGEEFAKNSAEPEALNEVRFTIAELSQTLRKKQIFIFTNGQAWQNRTNTKIKVELGDEVVISEGALGSFYMQKTGLNRKVAVLRMR